MDNKPTQELSAFDALIERFAFIKQKYGDEYPIILYEPAIRCQEKKILEECVEQSHSINLFDKFEEAFNFAQSLGISFILIVPNDFEDQHVRRNFESMKDTYGRQMFDFEEEALFKDIFHGISDQLIKSFKITAYVFVTSLEFTAEADAKEDEEEVMIMCDLKDISKEFRQEFSIIWYDPHIKLETKEMLTKKFDLEEKNIYTDFQEFDKRVDSSSDLPYHLVMTGMEAEKILDKMDQLKEMLLGLYIYSDDPEVLKRANRKIFVQDSIEKLCPKITEGIRTKLKLTNSFPAFATDFDAIDKTEIYYLHYYLRGLINFKNRKQAKDDFLNLVKKIYQSKKILEFEKEYADYSRRDIFKWYSAESPVYKLVNSCLRIATLDSILYCRFILRDLERAIREEYQEKSHQFSGVVYRGAYISQKEWEKLQGNVGKEIEMYGFLSTSKNIETAKNYVCSDFRNKVLITIIVPLLPAPELNDQGFAKIDQESGFQEAEILFNVRSKFRIVEAGATKINDKGKECRHLVLLYGAQLLRKYMTKEKPLISLEFKLPSVVKCDLCGSSSRLFAFHQETTEVRCIACLVKGQIPQDTLLVGLDPEKHYGGNQVITESLKGTMLRFHKTISFPFYGYKCFSCQGSEKGKYYQWIAVDEQKAYEQCSECFLKEEEMPAEILLSESNPYVMWQENETKLEAIDSDYQVEFSKKFGSKSQSDVYFEVQNFSLGLKYEKEVLRKWNKKRRREIEKIRRFEMLGKGEHSLGNYKKALEYYHRAQNITASILSPEHIFNTSFYGNIASLYFDLKEHQKALEYHQKTLDIDKLFYGERHSSTAGSYHNLATAYHNMGKYQHAFQFYGKALDIRKAIFGENHPETAKMYNAIALVYKDLGKHQQAIEYQEKALNIKLAIYGEKHFETAASYNNIGNVCRLLGKYQEALDFHQKVLDSRKAIYGEKHKNTADSYFNIGTAYLDLGLDKQAFEYNQKALDILKDVFGEKHSATASSYNNLALVYTNLGKYKEALEYQQKALSIAESLEGDEHPDIAAFYNNYATLCQTLGEHQKGLNYHWKALNIKKTIYGENHPETAASYGNIGTLHQELGKYQQALEYHQKALDITKEVYGENHSQIATSYYNIALVYQSLQENRQSMTYFTKALAIFRDCFGNKHSYVASSYNAIAVVYQNLGENKKALDYHQKALNIKQDIFGERHPETAASYHNIGLMYLHLRENKLALEYYEKALNINKMIFAENHPNIAASYSNIALVSYGQKDFQKALEYHERALNIQKIIYEENHPDIADSYTGLALVYKDLEEYNCSIDFCKKAHDIYHIIYGQVHPKTLRLYNLLAQICAQICQTSEK